MDNVQTDLNIAYAPGRRVDLFRPEAPNGCALLWVHGGGWRFGTPEKFHHASRHFAQLGYVCASCDYRLAPEHRFPAQLEDVSNAMRWLRGKADEFGIAPDRIAALGSSAGGHLVALLGMQEDPDVRPDVVVPLCAPTFLEGPDADGRPRPAREALLGGTFAEMPELYRAASPIHNITGTEPPYLLIHGSEDNTVPVEHSQVLAERLREAGVAVELIIAPGIRHGFAYGDRPVGDTTVYALMHAFLERNLCPTKEK